MDQCDEVAPKPSECGLVLRINGTIVDIQCEPTNLPSIYTLLFTVVSSSKFPEPKKIHLEVAQHLSDGIIRCIALEPLTSLSRGIIVYNTHGTIKAPVGKEVLGRVFDVL